MNNFNGVPLNVDREVFYEVIEHYPEDTPVDTVDVWIARAGAIVGQVTMTQGHTQQQQDVMLTYLLCAMPNEIIATATNFTLEVYRDRQVGYVNIDEELDKFFGEYGDQN